MGYLGLTILDTNLANFFHGVLIKGGTYSQLCGTSGNPEDKPMYLPDTLRESSSGQEHARPYHSFLRPSGKAGNVKAGNGIQSLRKAGNGGKFLGTVKFIEYKLLFSFSPPQAPPNGIFRLPSKN